jgi:hypothetical protein
LVYPFKNPIYAGYPARADRFLQTRGGEQADRYMGTIGVNVNIPAQKFFRFEPLLPDVIGATWKSLRKGLAILITHGIEYFTHTHPRKW